MEKWPNPNYRSLNCRSSFDNLGSAIFPSTTYVCYTTTVVWAEPKLSKLELQIMEALWGHGKASIREIQETFPEKRRPAYTTVQTTVYRLEAKNAVRRIKKVGNFHIFEAAVSRNAAQRRLIDDLLALFGGR